jgi:hypothetical protein
MTQQTKRPCCSGRPPQLVYIKLPRGSSVGLMGMEPLFEQLYQAGRRDDEALEAELVDQARVYNYVARGAEKDYGWALRQAYRCYVRAQEKGEQREWLPFTRP